MGCWTAQDSKLQHTPEVAPPARVDAAAAATGGGLAQHHLDPLQAPPPPPPPPPVRPRRPVRVPGFVFEAPSTAAAAQWMEDGTFFTHDPVVARSVRPAGVGVDPAPLFLWDGQAQRLHGVFQRSPDAAALLQDLAGRPGPLGYKVQVLPYYRFTVTLGLEDVEDVLLEQPPPPAAPAPAAPPAAAAAAAAATDPGGSEGGRFEPVIGSAQHAMLWEMLLRRAKRLRKHDQQQQEGAQQEQQATEQGRQMPA